MKTNVVERNRSTTLSAAGRALAEATGITVGILGSDIDIVENVSLAVRPGEIVGLVGESGSGKSTFGLSFLWHANRGLTIEAGSARIQGTDLSALSARQLRTFRGRKVTYVPQDPARALNPSIRIGDQLKEVLTQSRSYKTSAETDERTRAVLGEVGLPSDDAFLRKFAHQLSGGQQQRVTLAMAFACRPALVVLDEPTTGLDVNVQKKVLSTVRELCERYDTGAIYVSHDLAVVASISDRVAVMYSGRIVECGPTLQILSEPRHPYTRSLLDAVPDHRAARRLSGISGTAPSPGSRPAGCSFNPRCQYSLEVCRSAEPPVWTLGEHFSRCHRAGELELKPSAINEPTDVFSPLTHSGGLTVRNLSARYGTHAIVHDISLSIAPGECVAVVGESGSGKTTLSRCIVGMHSDFSGKVLWNDVELAPKARKRSSSVLRDVQYIFQNPFSALNPRRTVRDNLMQWADVLVGGNAAVKNDLVMDSLNQVGLSADYLSRFPDELSGGQQQRVAIARALVSQPKLIICDEITAALDVSVQASVMELLGRLQRERGLGMLFVTHNLPLVRSIAQRVLVMQAGRIVEEGEVAQIFAQPRADYTRELIGNTPSLRDHSSEGLIFDRHAGSAT